MALSVTHTFVSAIPDDADASLVRPSNWNDVHALSGVLPVANGGTGITSFGTGIDIFLGTPSSANLATAVTDETGTGALVFANTPTFVTPILGTPTSGNLANCTGYPVGSISGTVPATAGGTGLTSYAVGDILYAATTTTLAKLADIATGNALISGGVNTAPSWGKIALATAVSGNLPVANLNSGTNADNTHFWRGDGTWAVPASGGTPGGASLTLQYNNASAFGGMSGTSWDDINRSLTMTGATVTTSNPVLNMTQTWNAGAVVFTGLKLNVTKTANAAGSNYLDLQAGGASVFSVKAPDTTAIALATVTGQLSVVGSSNKLVANAVDNSFAIDHPATSNTRLASIGSSGVFGQFQFTAYTNSFTGASISLIASSVDSLPLLAFSTPSDSTVAALRPSSTANILQVRNGNDSAWSRLDAGQFALQGDILLTRAAAATLQFGAADAATAVAQTTQVQSVVAGNGNVAGADWTFVGSKSNGTGLGGSILFNLSQNTAASGSQNTAVQALKISPLGSSVGGGPSLQIGSGNTTSSGWVLGTQASAVGGIWSTSTSQSSTNYVLLSDGASTWLAAPQNSILTFAVNAGTHVVHVRSNNFDLVTGVNYSVNQDVYWTRSGAATWQQGAADAATAVAQTTQVQSVVAGNGNVAGADWTFVGSKSNGSGAGGAIIFNLSQSSAGSGSQNTAIQVLKIIPPGGNAGQTSIQIGSGSSSTTGWIMGYSGFSGFPGLWPTSVTPTNSNMCLSASTTSTTVNVPSGGTVDFRIANTVAGTFLSTSAFQFGAADAAAAIAQTTQVQSVVAGTASGTAGADWTFIGSSGTGVGVGGDIIFKTRPAGGASTSQNAPVEKFRIASAGQVTIANTLKITSGHLDMVSPGALIYFADDTNIFLDGNGRYQFPHSTGGISAHTGGVADSWIRSPAAATWQFGTFDAAAPIAQTVSIQSVVAGTANGTAGVDWIFKTSSGTGTGTGGNFILKTPFSAKSSGTGQGTWVDRDIYVSKGKVLTSATPVSLFEIALPAGAMAGGTIYSTIICTNGTDMQSFSQSVSYSVVNKAGAYTKSITAATGDKSVTGASTLTTVWTLLDGTNKSTVQVSATTSLTPSTNAFICYYSMANNSEQATTIL